MNTLTIPEFKDMLNFILDNNVRLEEQGKKKSAVEVIGESGIGKTSVIEQAARERNLRCVKINLSQIEELGDLVGFPIKNYQMADPDGRLEFVEERMLDNYTKQGYTFVKGAKSKMSYAAPEWLPEDSSEGGILLLDDWNRADPRFIQATMEIIDRGEYISWKLPKGWTVVLSANPETGDYNVSSQDNAQKTRYISFEVDFDHKAWAQWAEKSNIDGRCINFVLMYPEIMKKEGSVQTINARSLVTFFNTIEGIGDFQNEENLAKILMIAEGCFSSSDNIVGNLFTTFINNKLDKLVQPEDILEAKWETISKKLESCIYQGDNYRADVSATLTIRFTNHLLNVMDQKGYDADQIIQRIIDLVHHDDNNDGKALLSVDLLLNLCKKIVAKDANKMRNLLKDQKVLESLR